MRPPCLFVSEVAALIGRNRYKPADKAMVDVMNRNGLAHPDGRIRKAEEAKLEEVVQYIQTAVAAPPPEQTVQKVAAVHKVEAAVIAEAISKPEAELPRPVQAAVQAVKESVKREAVRDAVVKHAVPKADAAKAVRSREACDHGTAKEDTTRKAYNKSYGASQFDQLPVRKTYTTLEGNRYTLYGKLDGFDADKGCVVEFKNRMRRLFHHIPDYELPQLYAYMALLGVQQSTQVEQHGDDIAVHSVEFDKDEWTCILSDLDVVVDKMYRVDAATRRKGTQRGLREFFPTASGSPSGGTPAEASSATQ